MGCLKRLRGLRWRCRPAPFTPAQTTPEDENGSGPPLSAPYQLDPDLASANVAMALVSTSLSQTLQYLRRAIDLDPSNGDTYRDVADVIQTIAPDLSAAFERRALELDPQAAGGRAAVAGWRPTIADHQSPADALARDRELAVSVLAGLLDRHP